MAILTQNKPRSPNPISDVLSSAMLKKKLTAPGATPLAPAAAATPQGAGAPTTTPPVPPPARPPAVTPADYSSDPLLQEIKRTKGDELNQTNSSIDDQIRQLLIATGLRGPAEKELGGASPFLAGITDDPNGVSQASRLNRRYNDLSRQTDENLNDQGLFFSGTRVKQLGDLGHQQVVDKSDMASELLKALGGLHDQQAKARAGYNESISGAEGAARDRAIQLALLYGIGNPGGGNGNIVSAPGLGNLPGAEQYASGGQPSPFDSFDFTKAAAAGAPAAGGDLATALALAAAKKRNVAA